MENETQPLTLEVPRELFHSLLETLVQIRIKGKPITSLPGSGTDHVEIGNGIRVVETRDNHTQ